ncbi:unnamed protein product [Rotaria sp. Silwood2]|nr:unnamed protein product [Rotaria sp. Silwood2]
MLVIRNLRDIYTKFKLYWIEQQIINKNRIAGNSTLVKQSVNLWDRLNKDNLMPITLAADIDRSDTLLWLLDERKKYNGLLMININNEIKITDNKDSNMSCRIAYIIGYIIVISGVLFKLACKINEIYTLGLKNYVHSTGPVFIEYLLSCLFCLCILIVQFLRLLKIQYETVINAFACFLGWLYMFFFHNAISIYWTIGHYDL